MCMQNEELPAIFGLDIAENESSDVSQDSGVLNSTVRGHP